MVKEKKLYGLIEKNSSIKNRVRTSYAVIIGLMIIPIIIITFNSISLSRNYNRIIDNVTFATTLNDDKIKTAISSNVWDIMAGNATFEESNPYELVESIQKNLKLLEDSASSSESKLKIIVAQRAMGTLVQYLDKLKTQIINDALVDENENVVKEIKGVKDNIYTILQDFITLEIKNAAKVNDDIQFTQRIFLIVAFFIVALVIVFAILASSSLMEVISKPLSKLERFAEKIANGEFNEKVEAPKAIELIGLTNSLNTMSYKLEKLIEDNIRDQQSLKKAEIKTLQAQITPHFLYNTLDSIVWLAAEKKYKEVINITRAFSMYFRISLSKGEDWIPISKEITHAKNYLIIQKIRYRDILNYDIIVEDDILDEMILKLLLQPLIENALYHGVKNKREPGFILVKGFKTEDGIVFEVSDTGKGMSESEIEEVYKNLKDPTNNKSGGYGLYNVNQRLILYFGESSCLKIKSIPEEGTTVSFKIPLKEKDDHV